MLDVILFAIALSIVIKRISESTRHVAMILYWGLVIVLIYRRIKTVWGSDYDDDDDDND